MKTYHIKVTHYSATVCLCLSYTVPREERNALHDAFVAIRQNPGLLSKLFKSEGLPTFSRLPRSESLTSRDDSEECEGCVTGVEFLYLALDLGFEYEDLRDTVIDICLDIFGTLGQRGDLICQPILDNFGPEVTYILQNKISDGEQVCIELNVCDPGTPRKNKDAVYTKVNRSNSLEGKLDRSEKAAQSQDQSLRVVHIADIHVEENYITGSAVDCLLPICCRNETSGNGTASRWGEYGCNTPPRTLELFLNKIKDLDPDFIIYTGDNPPHAMWTETAESQLAASRWVASAMDRILGDYQVLPNIGNHETFPTNLYYLERNLTKELNREFARMWTKAANFGSDQINSLEERGYYTMQARPGLRIVSYNTNLGYVGNFYNLLDGAKADLLVMRDWLVDTLTMARESGEKVILSGHHPAGRFDLTPFYGQVITDICVQFSDVVVLHVVGHTHKDEFILMTDPVSSSVVGVQHVAPATTGYSSVNPSVRMFTLDSQTFAVQNYQQYLMDLVRAAASGEEPEIEYIYNAVDEYSLPDMSPASWGLLADRLTTDEELFEKYLQNRKTRNAAVECDEECRKTELCEIRFSSWDRVRACLNR